MIRPRLPHVHIGQTFKAITDPQTRGPRLNVKLRRLIVTDVDAEGLNERNLFIAGLALGLIGALLVEAFGLGFELLEALARFIRPSGIRLIGLLARHALAATPRSSTKRRAAYVMVMNTSIAVDHDRSQLAGLGACSHTSGLSQWQRTSRSESRVPDLDHRIVISDALARSVQGSQPRAACSRPNRAPTRDADINIAPFACAERSTDRCWIRIRTFRSCS